MPSAAAAGTAFALLPAFCAPSGSWLAARRPSTLACSRVAAPAAAEARCSTAWPFDGPTPAAPGWLAEAADVAEVFLPPRSSARAGACLSSAAGRAGGWPARGGGLAARVSLAGLRAAAGLPMGVSPAAEPLAGPCSASLAGWCSARLDRGLAPASAAGLPVEASGVAFSAAAGALRATGRRTGAEELLLVEAVGGAGLFLLASAALCAGCLSTFLLGGPFAGADRLASAPPAAGTFAVWPLPLTLSTTRAPLAFATTPALAAATLAAAAASGTTITTGVVATATVAFLAVDRVCSSLASLFLRAATSASSRVAFASATFAAFAAACACLAMAVSRAAAFEALASTFVVEFTAGGGLARASTVGITVALAAVVFRMIGALALAALDPEITELLGSEWVALGIDVVVAALALSPSSPRSNLAIGSSSTSFSGSSDVLFAVAFVVAFAMELVVAFMVTFAVIFEETLAAFAAALTTYVSFGLASTAPPAAAAATGAGCCAAAFAGEPEKLVAATAWVGGAENHEWLRASVALLPHTSLVVASSGARPRPRG